VSEIENACDLFINGHIHHCGYVTEKIINGGNLTGQNFTEDATKFEHCALIIDTDTMSVSFYKNPHALNFYKIDFTKSRNVIIAALILVLSIGVNYSAAGAILFQVGSITISISGIAAGALAGILMNAVLPDKE
jgi:hypothetical protein